MTTEDDFDGSQIERTKESFIDGDALIERDITETPFWNDVIQHVNVFVQAARAKIKAVDFR